MDQKLVNILANQIVGYISKTIGDEIEEILKQQILDEDIIEPLMSEIRDRLQVIADDIPKDTVAPAAAPKTSRASTTSSSSKKDTGDVPMCEATTKKGTPCNNKAKGDPIDGKHLCGLHQKSALNAKADVNAKPGAKSKTPATAAKGRTSFESVTGTSSSTVFAKHDFTSEVDNIDDDDL